MSSRYVIEVVAEKACGCKFTVDFDLPEENEPIEDADVAAVLFTALDPEEGVEIREGGPSLLSWLATREAHAPHGVEKISLTAQIKVRS